MRASSSSMSKNLEAVNATCAGVVEAATADDTVAAAVAAAAAVLAGAAAVALPLEVEAGVAFAAFESVGEVEFDG